MLAEVRRQEVQSWTLGIRCRTAEPPHSDGIVCSGPRSMRRAGRQAQLRRSGRSLLVPRSGSSRAWLPLPSLVTTGTGTRPGRVQGEGQEEVEDGFSLLALRALGTASWSGTGRAAVGGTAGWRCGDCRRALMAAPALGPVRPAPGALGRVVMGNQTPAVLRNSGAR